MSKPKLKLSPKPAAPVPLQSPPGGWWAHPAFICFALLAVTFALYWPVRGFDFTNYDDTDYIIKNWRVQTGLTWDNVRWAFTTGFFGNWLPLTWLSLMSDVTFFGHGAGAVHLVNAVIHAANGALVFLLLRRMTGATWRSALVAALFALHPLRVESVAWACERRDVLSSFFGLLAFICYAGFAQKAESRKLKTEIRPLTSGLYWLALACFAASLMSKPMLVTLPFALLLLDYWPLKRFQFSAFSFQLLLEKLPFFALAGFFSVLTVQLQKAAGAVSPLALIPLSDRIGNALVSYARYLAKTFWPVDLVLPYLHPGPWPMGQVALAALLVAGLCIGAVWLGRRHRFVATGWFWFFGILVPVIGIIQAGPQAMADRFVYLPAIGLLVVIVWGLSEWAGRNSALKFFLSAGAVVALLALGGRTAAQLQYWRDTGTLFEHTLTVEPENYAALNNLGVFSAGQGRGDEAIGYYQRALRINPSHAQTMNNLGNALAARGQYAEAIAQFQAALRITPNQPEAYVNLGGALAALGRVDEAIAQFKIALEQRPDYPDACNNLGNALAMKGSYAESIAILRRVIQFRPEDADSHYNLGNALALSGDLPAAVVEFRTVLRLQPGHPKAQINLGQALGMQGQWAEAVAVFESSLQGSPDNVEVQFHLAGALAKLGRRDEAVAYFMKVLQLRPGHAETKRALRELGIPIAD